MNWVMIHTVGYWHKNDDVDYDFAKHFIYLSDNILNGKLSLDIQVFEVICGQSRRRFPFQNGY